MDIVEEIKSRLDIVDFIGSYLSLKRTGQNYKALCPFHTEKTPSFMVSRERRSWHCFGCGEGGDIISFVEKMHNLSFLEALKMLAERAGVPFELPSGLREKSEKARIYEILENATRFYQEQLFSREAFSAREYLKKRGLDKETILKFRIGFADASWDKLFNFLTKKGFTPEELVKAGLIFRGRKGFIDLFRNRILFPVLDLLGKPVAFSGRILGAGEPKYLNSPETLIFKKSQMLLGLCQAKEAIREKGFATLVEGNFDLLVPFRFGYQNIVAPCGTAITEAQLELLSRYTDSLVIAFDADPAGQKAAFRAAILASNVDLSPKILNLPKGSDPADFVLKEPTAWPQLISEAEPAVFYFLGRFSEKYSPERPEGKKRLILELKPLVQAIANEIEKTETIIQLANQLNLSPEMLKSAIATSESVSEALSKEPATSQIKPSHILIGLLFRFKLPVPKLSQVFEESQDKAIEFLLSLSKEGVGEKVSWDDYLSKAKRIIVLRLNEVAQIVDELYSDFSKESAAEEVAKIIATLEKRLFTRKQKLLIMQIQEAEKTGDKETLKALLKKLIQISGG